jgi:GT2 family glycosyltransferase
MYTNKNTIKKLNGFNPDYFMFYEETDLCLRAKKENIPVYASKKIVYESNKFKSSSVNTEKIKYSNEIKSALKYHIKHNSFFKTKFTFIIIKLIYLFYIIILKIINSINKKRYFNIQKILSYYYKAI